MAVESVNRHGFMYFMQCNMTSVAQTWITLFYNVDQKMHRTVWLIGATSITPKKEKQNMILEK